MQNQAEHDREGIEIRSYPKKDPCHVCTLHTSFTPPYPYLSGKSLLGSVVARFFWLGRVLFTDHLSVYTGRVRPSIYLHIHLIVLGWVPAHRLPPLNPWSWCFRSYCLVCLPGRSSVSSFNCPSFSLLNNSDMIPGHPTKALMPLTHSLTHYSPAFL